MSFNTLQELITAVEDLQNPASEPLKVDGSNAMTANIDIGNNKVINMADGTLATDGATFGQLSTIPLKVDGSNAMTANIDIGNNKVINMADGTLATDGATFGQLSTIPLKVDGSNSPTANLPMGGFKHTGVANAAASDEYTTQGQLTDGSFSATVGRLIVQPTTANEAVTVIAKSGATGALAQLQNNATDPIFRVDNDGGIYVNSTTGSAGTNTALEVRAKNHTDSGPCFVSTFSELADTEQIGFIATGKRTGGNNRQALIGVYKHSGITETCAYLFLNSAGALSTYTWYDNSGILRVGTSASLIGTTGGTVIGTQTSDERLKEIDPVGVSYGLNTVKQLQPIAYIRKDDPDQTKRLGFGAQTTKAIVPEAVYDTREELEGEDPAETKLAMDYTTLIPVLVKAIQELEAKVASLESQLQSM